MIKPFGIFLLSLFMYSQVYNTSVWMNYEMNIKQITNEFCENTEKPELNCLGTCHLKKQLIQTDDSNPTESEQSLYVNEIQLFSSNEAKGVLNPQDIFVAHQTLCEENYSFIEGLGIFHPPKA